MGLARSVVGVLPEEQDPDLLALAPKGCTASFGVAQFVPGESVESLVGRADAALYAAKHAGRTCTMLATAANNPDSACAA